MSSSAATRRWSLRVPCAFSLPPQSISPNKRAYPLSSPSLFLSASYTRVLYRILSCCRLFVCQFSACEVSRVQDRETHRRQLPLVAVFVINCVCDDTLCWCIELVMRQKSRFRPRDYNRADACTPQKIFTRTWSDRYRQLCEMYTHRCLCLCFFFSKLKHSCLVSTFYVCTMFFVL